MESISFVFHCLDEVKIGSIKIFVFFCSCETTEMDNKPKNESKNKINNTRDFIVSVAQNAFARFGFNKTTMDDVAQLAAKGRRTIYIHFRDKKELYHAVVQKEISGFMDTLKSSVYEKESLEASLHEYAITRMKLIIELLDHYSLLKEDFTKGNSRVLWIRKLLQINEFRILSKVFEEEIAKNNIQFNGDIKEITRHFIYMLTALEGDMIGTNLSPKMQKRLNHSVDLFLNGIVKKD